MNSIIRDILLIILGVLMGSLPTRYFWNLNNKKEIPRLIIGAEEDKDRTTFYLKNTGPTHASNITVSDKRYGDSIKSFYELEPNQSEQIQTLEEDEQMIILVSYEDSWKKIYKSTWKINGPQVYERETNDGVIMEREEGASEYIKNS